MTVFFWTARVCYDSRVIVVSGVSGGVRGARAPGGSALERRPQNTRGG